MAEMRFPLFLSAGAAGVLFAALDNPGRVKKSDGEALRRARFALSSASGDKVRDGDQDRYAMYADESDLTVFTAWAKGRKGRGKAQTDAWEEIHEEITSAWGDAVLTGDDAGEECECCTCGLGMGDVMCPCICVCDAPSGEIPAPVAPVTAEPVAAVVDDLPTAVTAPAIGAAGKCSGSGAAGTTVAHVNGNIVTRCLVCREWVASVDGAAGGHGAPKGEETATVAVTEPEAVKVSKLDELASAPTDAAAVRRAAAREAAEKRAAEAEAQADDVVPCETKITRTVLRGRGKKRGPVEITELKKITSRLGIMPVDGTETGDGAQGQCPECRAMVALHTSGAVGGHKRSAVTAKSAKGGKVTGKTATLPTRQTPPVGPRGEDVRSSDVLRAVESAAAGSDEVLENLRADVAKLTDRLDADDFVSDEAQESARQRLTVAHKSVRAAQAVASGEVTTDAQHAPGGTRGRASIDGTALIDGKPDSGYVDGIEKRVWSARETFVGEGKYGRAASATPQEYAAMTRTQKGNYWKRLKNKADRAKDAARAARVTDQVLVVAGSTRGHRTNKKGGAELVTGEALSREEMRAARKGASVIGRGGVAKSGQVLSHYGVTREAVSLEDSQAAAGL